MRKKGGSFGATKKTPWETDPATLRGAMRGRLERRFKATGVIELPAAPGFLDHYVNLLGTVFGSLGRAFTPDELEHARGLLKRKIDEAWAISRACTIVVRYETEPPPAVSLDYTVEVAEHSMEAQYTEWLSTVTPPLFGAHPDARVMAVALELGDPAQAPVLDLGAGTGRNTLPLAHLGHPVEALEVTPQFALVLAAAAEKFSLPVRVHNLDISSPEALFDRKFRLVILSEVVSDMRTVEQVRRAFVIASEALLPGGYLLFNVFLAASGYTPDAMVHDLSRVLWASVFTRAELNQASAGLGFELVSDESVHDYEKAHLPPEAWPPKDWYPAWTSGQDIFDLPEGRSPITMRWLLYRYHPSP